MTNAIDWPARLAEVVEFVELTEEDRLLIRSSAPIINKHARSLTDTLYDRFLEYPKTRKFFVTEADEADEERIEGNKLTMIRWLRDTGSVPLGDGFARYLRAIGMLHRNLPPDRAQHGPVPSQFVIATIAFYQTAIATLLGQNIPDTDLAARTCIAWNKLLVVELDMLLGVYLNDR
jgi:hypothetical protein